MRTTSTTMNLLIAVAVCAATALGDDAKATAPIGQPRLRAAHEEFLRDVLGGFTRSDPGERRDAIDRMARAGDTAVPFLLDELRAASDPLLRREILLALGQVGGGMDAIRETVENDRGQEDERTVAVLVLGRLGERGDVPTISRIALERRPSMLRRAAILAAGRLGDADGVGRLVERMGRESLTEDQVAILLAAAAVADRVWLPSILAALEGERSALVRRAAAVAIGRIGDPAALSGILEALRGEREESVESALVLAMAAFEDSASREAVASRLDSRDATVLRASVAVLAARPDGVAVLERWFAAPRPSEQRVLVATVLSDAADRAPLRDVLEAMLSERSAELRSAAGLTLAAYGGEASAQPILGWFAREKDAQALEDAIVVVGVLGLQSARERLNELPGPKALIDEVLRTMEDRRDPRHLLERLERRIAARGVRLRDQVREARHELVEIALDIDSIQRRGPASSGSTEVGEPGGSDDGPDGMPEGFGHRRLLRIDPRNLAVERDLELWFDRAPYFEPEPNR